MRASLPGVRALVLLLGFYLFLVAALAAIVGLDLGLTSASNHQGGLALAETWGVSLLLAYPLLCGLLVGNTGNPGRPVGLRVRPADQPRLWQHVERAAKSTAIRPPAEIWLVDRPEAALQQGSWLLGLIPGRRRLVLGLPLLHVLTCSELDAVIAHELGHFGLVHRNRTSLRQVLPRGSSQDPRTGQWLNGVFASYARFCLRITQDTAQHQEQAADAAAARLAGPEAMIGALRATAPLAQAHRRYLGDYRDLGWNLDLVPSADLVYPGFQTFLRTDSWQQECAQLSVAPQRQKQPRYDPHPPLPERIEQLRRLPAKTAATPDPALTVLSDPVATCAQVASTRPGAAERRQVDWDTLAAAAGRAELDQESAGIRDASWATLRSRTDLPLLLDAVDAGRWKEIADWMPREGMSRTVTPEAARSMTEAAAADGLYSWLLTDLVAQGRAHWHLDWEQGKRLHLTPAVEAALPPALDTALTPQLPRPPPPRPP
ncbi:M48 family metallopeptidase, partial [Streptacidiphilus carbonis]|uniref:M48 family metallopeptidase n=1 Tax=Streptacidiphilus carbonis TaxID=105422 RepID=UPI001378FF24